MHRKNLLEKAAEQYAKGQTFAVAVSRAMAAKEAFEKALAKYNMDRLKRYGGQAWAKVESDLQSVPPATQNPAGAAMVWQRALASLPAVARDADQAHEAEVFADRVERLSALLTTAPVDDTPENRKAALAALDELLKLDPRHADALIRRQKGTPHTANDWRAYWLTQAILEAEKISNNDSGLLDVYKSGAYLDIVEAQAQAGDMGRALIIANRMRDGFNKNEAYECIASIQARAGNSPGANATAARLSDSIVQPATYSNMAEAQAEAGDIAGARATVQRITDAHFRSLAYLNLAKVKMKAGGAAWNKQMIAAAVSAAEQVEVADVKLELYMEIAAEKARTGDVAGAKTIAERIAAPGSKQLIASFQVLMDSEASMHCEIAKAQLKAGDRLGSRHSFLAAVAIAEQLQYAGDKASKLESIVLEQTYWGDFEGAEATANRITEASTKESVLRAIANMRSLAGDIEGVKATGSRVVEQHLDAGNIESAKDAAELILSDKFKSESYGLIAVARAKTGNASDAKRVAIMAFTAAKRIADAQEGANALAKTATIQIQLDDIAGAKQTIQVALFATERITQNEKKVDSFLKIATAQVRAGDTDNAKQTVSTAIAVASKIQDDEGRARVYLGIARVRIQLGDFKGLNDWAMRVHNPRERVRILVAAANGLLPEEPEAD